MSEREELAEWFHETTMGCAHYRGDILECILRAHNLLGSDWLAARNARIRADIAAEVQRPIEFIAAICEAREMLAPGDRDIQTIKGIADAVLSTAKADE